MPGHLMIIDIVHKITNAPRLVLNMTPGNVVAVTSNHRLPPVRSAPPPSICPRQTFLFIQRRDENHHVARMPLASISIFIPIHAPIKPMFKTSAQ